MEQVGKRIKEARESLKPAPMKQLHLAERIGVSSARLSNWENGLNMPAQLYLERIAEALGVQNDWLTSGTPPMRINHSPFRSIPLYGAINAGVPGAPIADPEEIEIRAWASGNPRWARMVHGTSMQGGDLDDLVPGDIAVFEARSAESGHVVQAYRDGEDTVKVLKRQEGAAWLIPTNSDFEPFSASGWEIKGVLVMRMRRREQDILETIEYPHGLRPKVQPIAPTRHDRTA